VKTLLALLLFASLAWATPPIDLNLRGTMHRVPAEGSLMFWPDTNKWEACFWHDDAAQRQVQLYICGITGYYETNADNTLTFRTESYQKGAYITLESLPQGRYRIVDTNVDLKLDTIVPK